MEAETRQGIRFSGRLRQASQKSQHRHYTLVKIYIEGQHRSIFTHTYTTKQALSPDVVPHAFECFIDHANFSGIKDDGQVEALATYAWEKAIKVDWREQRYHLVRSRSQNRLEFLLTTDKSHIPEVVRNLPEGIIVVAKRLYI